MSYELDKMKEAHELLGKVIQLQEAGQRHAVEYSKLLKAISSFTDCDMLWEWAYEYEHEAELTEEEMRELEWDELDIQAALEDRRIYAQESS